MTPSPPSSSSLLLLPAPPQSSSPELLHAAYHASISSVVSQLPPSSTLTVAITGKFLPPSWSHLQSLLARLYSLVASVSDNATIDVRLILVDHKPNRDYGQASGFRPDLTTAIPDLSSLVAAAAASFKRKSAMWSKIFHPSSEAGYGLRQDFLSLAENSYKLTFLHQQLVAVSGGIQLANTPTNTTSLQGSSEEDGRYGTICLGGTFDHLHPGHKLLLHAAVLLLSLPKSSDSPPAVFIIGISGDALLTKKQYASVLEPWPVRAQSVISFLSTILPSSSSSSVSEHTSLDGPIGDNEEIRVPFCDGRLLARCVNIPDPFGPTITEEAIDAIVVSGETRSGGAAINDKREQRGWKPLRVFEIDVLNVYDEEGRDPNDYSAKISSTEIRKRLAENTQVSDAGALS